MCYGETQEKIKTKITIKAKIRKEQRIIYSFFKEKKYIFFLQGEEKNYICNKTKQSWFSRKQGNYQRSLRLYQQDPKMGKSEH